MNKNKLNILVVNDDGIHAEGLHVLATLMQPYGTVTVVAPADHQSGQGHAVTTYGGLKVEELIEFLPGVKAYKVHGKPADCTRFGIGVLGIKFDLVVSGINHGPNLGTDVLYSGTVAAATEATVHRIPGIAFSSPRKHLEIAKAEMKNVMALLLNEGWLLPDTVFNVNFPIRDFKQSKGIRLTIQGKKQYEATYDRLDDLYHSRPVLQKHDESEDSDVYAAKHGYISVTPLKIDRTDVFRLSALKEELKQLNR